MLLRERNAADMQSLLEIPFPTNWLESLYQLLKASPNAKYRTIHALLVAVADGNFEGGMMLYWLLKLLPKSKRADGAVYKSAVQWQAERGLTKSQVKRVNKSILSRFFDITVKKAHGAPTNHYRLNGWAFLRRLSDVLGLPAYYLLLKIQKVTNGLAEKQPMDWSQSSQSLTDSTTNKTTKQESVNDSVPSIKVVDFKSSAIELLKKAGLSHEEASDYAHLPVGVIEACIASSNEPTVRNRKFYLLGALRNKLKEHKPVSHVATSENFPSESTEAPPPNPLPIANNSARWVQEMTELVEVAQAEEASVDWGARWEETKRQLREAQNTTPKPEPVPENLAVLVNDKTTAYQAWNSMYQQLSLQLHRQDFYAYFSRATLVDYESEQKCLVVKVENTHIRDMCQHRFIKTATRILRDVTGLEVSVRFEVYKDGKVIPAEEHEAHDAPLQRFLASKPDSEVL